jgi:hypothetical protein
MFQMLFISQLHAMGLEPICIMQQGGQLAHCALTVQKYLNSQSVDDGLNEDLMLHSHLEVQA